MFVRTFPLVLFWYGVGFEDCDVGTGVLRASVGSHIGDEALGVSNFMLKHLQDKGTRCVAGCLFLGLGFRAPEHVGTVCTPEHSHGEFQMPERARVASSNHCHYTPQIPNPRKA